MGKVKLKSSLKVLQIALSKLKVSKLSTEEEEEEERGGREAAVAGGGQQSWSSGWSFSCGQPRTHSSRLTTNNMTTRGGGDGGRGNVYSSFNSLYIVSDLKPHTAQSLFPLVEEEEEEGGGEEDDCCKGVSKRSSVMICDEKGRIFDMLPDADNSFRKFKWDVGGFLEEETSMEMEFTSKSSNYSSDFSSESSRSTDFVAGVVRGLSSERFFFSPGRSNSILEEAKWQQPHKIQLVRDHRLAGRRKIDMPSQTETETHLNLRTSHDVQENESEETTTMDLCTAIAECHNDNIIHDIFLKDSVAMKMNSRDPYLDFRISMEEMVDAHNLKDWSCLQELLCCYLHLNKKKTHRFIVGAFADLVMNRMATNRTSTPLLGYAPRTD